MTTTFETLFKERYPQFAFLLTRMNAAWGTQNVNFSDINTTSLRRFKEYMESEVSSNSLKTYFAILKSFLKESYYDGLIQNIKCISALKVKSTPQQNVALTEDEVRRLYSYYERLYTQDGHQVEKDVLTLFLIECYCGARGCDVECFSMKNIQNGVLSYVSKKTKTLATMPAHKHLPQLIQRIPNRTYQRMVKNRIIKEACERVGIIEPVTIMYRGKMRTLPKYEYLGMHSARRSCITNILNRGVPLVQVSKLAGHSTTQMTTRYYCSDKIELDANAMAFFNG